MNKKRLLLVIPIIILTVAGCVDLSPTKPKTQGGNSILGENQSEFSDKNPEDYSIDIVNNEKSASERIDSLKRMISLTFNEADKIEIELDNLTTWNDYQHEIKQLSKEEYEGGALKQYFSEIKANQFSYRTFYNGEKYFVSNANSQWEEVNGDSKVTTLYLYLMKILLEGNDTLEVVEGLDQIRILKKIEDDELKAELFQLIDIPILFTPNAELEASFEYQVDEKTGEVSVVNATIDILDLGQSYQTKLRAKVTMDGNFEGLSINVDEMPHAIETEGREFSEYFLQANDADSINYYEQYLNEISGDETQVQLKMGNYLKGHPYASISGNVVDSNLLNIAFNYGNKEIKIDKGKPVEKEYHPSNDYKFFVEQIIDTYDQLELLEDTQDDTTYTLRHLFENDFETFNHLGGALDLDRLGRDQEAVYGIDYIIHRESQQLESVYFWSTVAGEESISLLTSLSFTNINAINPNFIKQNVDPMIWDYLK